MTRIDFDSAVAVVTGGASGIGRACILEFASSGATVVILDLNEEGGNRVAEECRDRGVVAHFIPTDCAQPDSIDQAYDDIGSRFGGIRAAVNAAASMGSLGRAATYPLADWVSVLNLNLTGLFLCLQAELRLMSAGGAVVNIASLAGIRGVPAMPAYTASKHGVVGLSKSVALEYASLGMRVNVICPGLIETPMAAAMAETAGLPLHSLGGPSGRLGQPAEVANAAVWLCSDLASYVTGQVVSVDGGNSAASGGSRATDRVAQEGTHDA